MNLPIPYKSIEKKKRIKILKGLHIGKRVIKWSKKREYYIPPNSKYVESYSLAGFKILGGCYTFLLTGSEIKDFVHFGPTRDPQLQDWVYYDVIFPDKINNYRLYRGEFYTNKVDVTFKKSPDL